MVFPPKVIGNLGRIPNGELVSLLKPNKFCVTGTSHGEPSIFQAVEERILIDAPSSIIVSETIILQNCTMMQKGT